MGKQVGRSCEWRGGWIGRQMDEWVGGWVSRQTGRLTDR